MFFLLVLPVPLFSSSISYEYDELDRLHVVTFENGQKITYEYDEIGNMVSKTPSGNYVAIITATTGTGGTIYPIGTTAITYGSTKTFRIEPDQGYQIADVLVDSVLVEAINSDSGGTIKSYTFNSLHSNHTITARFIANPPLALTTLLPLPDAVGGTFYSQTMKATGGMLTYPKAGTIPTYSWSLKWGSSLPPGLTLNEATGVISGIPTQGGNGTFFIGVIAPDSGTGLWPVTINVAGITTKTMSQAKTYMPYNEILATAGLTAPFTWSVSSGSLPVGFNLDTSTGVVSGMPTVAGCSSFTVKVKDSLGKTPTASLALCTTTPPVRIANKQGYLTIKDAYTAAVDRDVIQLQSLSFKEDVITSDINKNNMSLTLDGGYSSDFTTNNGMTTIQGAPHIVGGTVKMKNIRILN